MARKAARPASKSPSRKVFPWVLVGLLVVIFLSTGGFAFAASQEAHDSFCGSCHTQPESEYLQRSTAADAVDLASFHTPQETRCIDCHSGQGVAGRVAAELMGAMNAIRWYSGSATQPAPLTHPIGDGNCLKCHDAVTQEGYIPKNQTLQSLGEAENGHWHIFLPRWQAQSSNAAKCVTCHSSHSTDGQAQILYLNEARTTTVCDGCHQVLRED